MVVRVTGIDTGTLGSSEWRIEAMEDVFGLDNAVLAPPPPIIDEPTLEPLPPALVLAVGNSVLGTGAHLVTSRTGLPDRHRCRLAHWPQWVVRASSIGSSPPVPRPVISPAWPAGPRATSHDRCGTACQ